MIILCLFIGYQPHICPKNLILVQKVSFLDIDRFDLLDLSKTKQKTKQNRIIYLVSTNTSKIIYKCYSHTHFM